MNLHKWAYSAFHAIFLPWLWRKGLVGLVSEGLAWEQSPNTTLGFPILALERHFTVGRIIMQTWGILHFWFLPRTDFFLLQLTYLRATCFTLQKAIMVSALSLPQTLTGVEIWMWFFWGRNRHVVLNEASLQPPSQVEHLVNRANLEYAFTALARPLLAGLTVAEPVLNGGDCLL